MLKKSVQLFAHTYSSTTTSQRMQDFSLHAWYRKYKDLLGIMKILIEQSCFKSQLQKRGTKQWRCSLRYEVRESQVILQNMDVASQPRQLFGTKIKYIRCQINSDLVVRQNSIRMF